MKARARLQRSDQWIHGESVGGHFFETTDEGHLIPTDCDTATIQLCSGIHCDRTEFGGVCYENDLVIFSDGDVYQLNHGVQVVEGSEMVGFYWTSIQTRKRMAFTDARPVEIINNSLLPVTEIHAQELKQFDPKRFNLCRNHRLPYRKYRPNKHVSPVVVAWIVGDTIQCSPDAFDHFTNNEFKKMN